MADNRKGCPYKRWRVNLVGTGFIPVRIALLPLIPSHQEREDRTFDHEN